MLGEENKQGGLAQLLVLKVLIPSQLSILSMKSSRISQSLDFTVSGFWDFFTSSYSP